MGRANVVAVSADQRRHLQSLVARSSEGAGLVRRASSSPSTRKALERTQLPLPLRTGRARRHTHDCKRHGVVDLYAALEVATGKVTHRVSDSHTATDFLAGIGSAEFLPGSLEREEPLGGHGVSLARGASLFAASMGAVLTTSEGAAVKFGAKRINATAVIPAQADVNPDPEALLRPPSALEGALAAP